MEVLIVGVIVLFVATYRASNGKDVSKFIGTSVKNLYGKLEPYSYKEMRKKIKQLGIDYTPKQYIMQVVLLSGGAALVGYMYFYDLVVSLVYAIIAVGFIPYLTYLRSKR